MNTGYCGDTDEENPWYVDTTCGKDSASGNNYSASPTATTTTTVANPTATTTVTNAEWYLNMNVKDELTKRIVTIPIESGISTFYGVTEADVQAYSGGSNCPVMGLFRAGMIRRGTDTGKGPYEEYDIQLAYDNSIYKDYGLVAVKRAPPSDVCTSKEDKKDDDYDRRVPCRAHDYCYDLIRFAVAPDLSENNCDELFEDLMDSDCADRDKDSGCTKGSYSPGVWKLFVILFSTPESEKAPGVVIIRNVETDMCVDVTGSSDKDGTPLIQNRCEEGGITLNQQFRFHRDREVNYDAGTVGPWHFHIRPEHTLHPNPKIRPEIQLSYCVSVTDDNNVVMRIPPCSTTDGADPDDIVEALFYLVEENASIDNKEERYTIRNIDSPNRCLSPETSGTKARLINRSPCQRDSNLHLWEIKQVGCWVRSDTSDQKARLSENTLCDTDPELRTIKEVEG